MYQPVSGTCGMMRTDSFRNQDTEGRKKNQIYEKYQYKQYDLSRCLFKNAPAPVRERQTETVDMTLFSCI